MKKGLIGLLCAMNSLVAISQTLDDAKKYIYYERYKTAEDLLQKMVTTEPANAEAWYLLSKACLLSDDGATLQPLLSKSKKTQPIKPIRNG
jgi:predicted Zn-dependent protease